MNNHGEEYPEEIKPIMDKGEERISRAAEDSFSKWNTRLANWVKNITTDINKENAKRVEKSMEVLDVPQEKVKEGLKKILTPDMFEVNLSPLKTVMQGAVGNEFNRIRGEIGKKDRIKKSDGDISIDWDIEYDTGLYNSIIDARQADLADMLHSDSVDEISQIIKKATTEGWSEDQLMEALQEVCGFDKVRSQRIGRTEANYAANQAILTQTHRIGIEEYNISAAPDACEECQEAADDGPYDYSEAQELLPVHPSCRCVLQSVIPDEWLEEPEIEKSMQEIQDDLLIKSERMNDSVVKKVSEKIDKLSENNKENISSVKEDINKKIESLDDSVEVLKSQSVKQDDLENIIAKSLNNIPDNKEDILQKIDLLEKYLKNDLEVLKKKELVSPKEITALKEEIKKNKEDFEEIKKSLSIQQPQVKDYVTEETPFEGLPLDLKERIISIEKMIKTMTLYVPATQWGKIQGDITKQKDLMDTFITEESDPIYTSEKSLYVTKNDSSDVQSISSLDRKLYNASGSEVYDWQNGSFKDANGDKALDLENRQLLSGIGANNRTVANWESDIFGVSAPGGYKASLDANALTQPRSYIFPDKDGTFTMTQDLMYTSVNNQSTDYSIIETDRLVRFTATATVTLPSASGSGRIITLVCDADQAVLTITPSGSDTVNREISQTLYDGDSITIVDVDSGQWNII